MCKKYKVIKFLGEIGKTWEDLTLKRRRKELGEKEEEDPQVFFPLLLDPLLIFKDDSSSTSTQRGLCCILHTKNAHCILSRMKREEGTEMSSLFFYPPNTQCCTYHSLGTFVQGGILSGENVPKKKYKHNLTLHIF